MVRGERRRSPGAPAALRWIAADARDVTRIDRGTAHSTIAVATIAGGVRRWQRRVERRRLLALIRRGALAGITAACLLQIGALATGRSGPGVWLVPAGIVAAVSYAIGLAHRTSAAAAARLLDRDLELGARVSTALELETTGRGSSNPHGLGALALADGRGALGASLAGARARLRPRHGELALLGALAAGLAVLVVVPSPRTGGGSAAATLAKARTAQPSFRALRAENGLRAGADAGPSLQGFKQTPLDAPPLAAVQAGGTARSGGASSGHSPYGGGVASHAAAGSIGPASRTLGQSGAVRGTQDDGGSSSSAGAGSGSLADRSGGTGKEDIPGGSRATGNANGAKSVAPASKGVPSASAPGGPTSGTASRSGGPSQGGIGSSVPGTAPGAKPGKTTPGGGTAGSTNGGKSRGKGVVPQLGASNSALPLAPGYEAVPGSKGATEESASSTVGRAGGTGHSGQAIGGVAGSGGGAGVPYVPPGGASVASIDRGVVLGYFASFARVNASGW